jgi:LacI family transcriptional regulator
MNRKKIKPLRLDIRTVAQTAGVSVATVSRVINNVQSVDPKLGKRVWDAVSQLGYIPNTQARALVSGKSKLFGLIISDITNPFFPELIQGFEDKAVEVGYETLIGSTNYDLRRMELCVQRMLERKVEGVAVMTFGIEEPLLERLTSQRIPMVFVDIAPPEAPISAIKVDYCKGFFEAVQHLAVLGHRRIAFLRGPLHLHSATARMEAFQEAAASIGLRIPPEYIFSGNHTTEMGSVGAETLLSLENPPSAILCSNDMTAIGVMHAALRKGLRIPEDLSLIGFDDIKFAQFMLPPLTTIRMSGREIAANAVLALKEAVGPDAPMTVVPPAIKTTLIVRQSTAIPRGSLSDLISQKRSKKKKTVRE